MERVLPSLWPKKCIKSKIMNHFSSKYRTLNVRMIDNDSENEDSNNEELYT